MLLKLAFKNIVRSGTRSLITLAAISAGCVAVIIAGGFIGDSIHQITEGYINAFLGHIQIAEPGYFQKGITAPFDYSISNTDRLLPLLASTPHVKRVSPRLQFSALVGAGDSSIAVMAQGIDPGAEAAAGLTAGKDLEGQDAYQVVLGTGLAQALGSTPGSSLTLLASTKAGGVNGMDMVVKGVMASASKDYDDHFLRIPLKTAQNILRTTDVQTVTLYLDRTENSDLVAADIAHRLSTAHMRPLDVRPWHELPGADFVVKLVRFYGALFLIFRVIIVTVVILGIFNTMNMAVLERVGEIGTLMAMGTTRAEVIGLFLLEGLMLGALGGLIGLAVGGFLAKLISAVGIVMPTAPGTTFNWVARIAIMPSAFAWAYAMAIGAALFSSVYPAVKASRLEIAEALRHNV